MAFELTLSLVLSAFICDLIDSSLGTGYGTTLTPPLLELAYKPAHVRCNQPGCETMRPR